MEIDDEEKTSTDRLDADIERALTAGDNATYCIKNMLRGKYEGLTTSAVRRRLISLTAKGTVVRKTNPYGTKHICWGLVSINREKAER